MFIRGWIGYFRVTDMKRMLMSWDEWMRRRLRMYIWKQWKKPRTKVANLRKLGIPADRAYQWGNSRLGYRRIAGSPVLKCSITNERPQQRDTSVSSATTSPCTHVVEPPCTGRYARWRERSALYLGKPPTRVSSKIYLCFVR